VVAQKAVSQLVGRDSQQGEGLGPGSRWSDDAARKTGTACEPAGVGNGTWARSRLGVGAASEVGSPQGIAPPRLPRIRTCRCRDRIRARDTVRRRVTIAALSVAAWEPSSTMGYVSRSLPAIPDGRISHIRF